MSEEARGVPEGRQIVRLGQVLAGGLALVVLAIRLAPADALQKDVQAIYLSALALRQGADPLAPMPELAGRYWPGAAVTSPLPNHLPPLLTLLCVPLTFLPPAGFAALWLLFNLGLLCRIGGMLGLPGPARIALAAWPPAFWVLDNGNLEIVVLALLVLSWRCARGGDDGRAGLWLGAAAAVKFYPILFLAPFVVRRRLRLLGAALLTAAAGQVANLLVLGPAAARVYYGEVLPGGSGLWQRLALNSAPHGALLRLFGGAEDVGPVVSWEWLIRPAMAALLVLAALAWLRLEPEDAPGAAFVALPNVRGYFSVLLLPQMLRVLGDRPRSAGAGLACVAASVTLPVANAVTLLVRSGLSSPDGALSSFAALATAVQPAGYVALLVARLMTSRRAPRPEAPGPASGSPRAGEARPG